jgi:tetratricopeptide (TPR) repeat protein
MNGRKHRSAAHYLIVGLVAYGLASQCAFARGPEVPRDQAEAIKWLEDGLKHAGMVNINVNSQYVLFADGAKNSYGIALARVISSEVRSRPEMRDGFPHSYVTWQDYAHDKPESVSWVSGLFGNGGIGDAKEFKSALDFLSAAARNEFEAKATLEFAQFQVAAKSWRETAVKPPMPDAAHDHQVLAEYAFKEKDTDKAINEYTAALGIYPYWPEGQFNLATLAGEKKLYAVAVFHMKEYLELVPDSPDAQAAKDSVIIWRDKLQTLQTAVNSNVNASASGSMFQQISSDKK